MARIPDDEVERLKREVSVERLAEARGIKLKRLGADLHGLCPFHDDQTPSLVITPAKNLWHCMGACAAGGTAIDWVMRANGVSFRGRAAEARPSSPGGVLVGSGEEEHGAEAARSGDGGGRRPGAALGDRRLLQRHRVAKGEVPSKLGCSTGSSFVPTETDILGQAGEQFNTLDPSGWQRTNVFANGQLLATYYNSGVYFALNDWLGTKRVLAGVNSDGSGSGVLAETYKSLPFGDGIYATGSPDASDHHYTGQLHDTQSGLDYFGARFYAGNMGRFLSPDPIIQNDLRLLNPQRWNKYSYAINNPLTLTDPTGKDAAYVDFSKGAGGFGHAGLISIRSDGTATYSAFVPAGNGPSAYAPGQVQLQDLTGTVQFGANGLPTAASYDSLIQQVAKINGSDPYNVGIDYFKTTDAETSNLDQYIIQKAAAYRAGQAPTYKLCLYDCRDYALGGLVAAGVLGQGQAHGFSLDPNSVFQELNFNLADQQVPHEPKACTSATDSDGNATGTVCQ